MFIMLMKLKNQLRDVLNRLCLDRQQKSEFCSLDSKKKTLFSTDITVWFEIRLKCSVNCRIGFQVVFPNCDPGPQNQS